MNFKITIFLFSLIMLLSLFSLSETLKAQDNKWFLGDSIQEKRASAMLQTIEKGDDASIRQFINEHTAPSFRDMAPMEGHIAQFQRMRRNLAGMQPVGVDLPGPNAVAVLLKVNGDKFMRLSLIVEPDAPNLIVEAGLSVAEAPGSKLKFSSFDELDQQLRKMADEDRFSGVVLVGQGDRIAFHKAYGMANRDNRVPNKPDTLFDLGSINKQFTAVSIMRLVQDGRLNLDDKIGKYLKGFSPEVADKVTIRQLLQHRSGMGDYLTSRKFNENLKGFRTVNDYLELARATPLRFEPGTSDGYSNLGYVVLGGIIEAITGRSYYEVVEDYVYKPAGMKSSGSFEPGTGKNMAIGYTRKRRGEKNQGNETAPLISNLPYFAPKGSPAGGGFSTAEDLRRYMGALLNNRLLNEENTNLFLSNFNPSKEGKRPEVFGFAGGAEGVNAAVFMNMKTQQTVIVLSNFDMPVAEDVAEALAAQLDKIGLFVQGNAQMPSFKSLSSSKQTVNEVDQYLKKKENLGFSGVILVSEKGKILIRKGYGLADKEQSRPVVPETGFDIGSLVKDFTLTAIYKLESQGKLKISDTISKFFPEAPPDKANITVEQLLMSKSGFTDMVPKEDGTPFTSKDYSGDFDYMPLTRDQMVRGALKSKLLFEPGTKRAYSNLAYGLVAAIIEISSGQKYEEYLREHLFKPAGMTKTGYLLPGWKREDLAVGYMHGKMYGTPLDFNLRPNHQFPSWVLMGSGGMISNVDDLLLWRKAFAGDQMLPKTAKDKMFSFYIRKNEEGKRVTPLFAGGNGAYNSAYTWHVDDDRIFIMLSNVDKHEAEYILPEVIKIVAKGN